MTASIDKSPSVTVKTLQLSPSGAVAIQQSNPIYNLFQFFRDIGNKIRKDFFNLLTPTPSQTTNMSHNVSRKRHNSSISSKSNLSCKDVKPSKSCVEPQNQRPSVINQIEQNKKELFENNLSQLNEKAFTKNGQAR